ncbi:hypothetical protein ASG20_15600 [Sphingomonas sp. Leaf198]|nr:hypothetical protein ASG20_15600 [Sphingomonas sp. Leaf198]
MQTGMRFATMARPHSSVILTKVRIQSHKGPRAVTLDPDFRQDDGVLAAARIAAPATVTAAMPATPTPLFTPFPRTKR